MQMIRYISDKLKNKNTKKNSQANQNNFFFNCITKKFPSIRS